MRTRLDPASNGRPLERQRTIRIYNSGRIGQPEEIARAAVHPVSDYADFITGEVLVMDGGQWMDKGMSGEGAS
ncbi:MAG: SDR family oxidoreductase [Terriglobia bacterium]